MYLWCPSSVCCEFTHGGLVYPNHIADIQAHNPEMLIKMLLAPLLSTNLDQYLFSLVTMLDVKSIQSTHYLFREQSLPSFVTVPRPQWHQLNSQVQSGPNTWEWATKGSDLLIPWSKYFGCNKLNAMQSPQCQVILKPNINHNVISLRLVSISGTWTLPNKKLSAWIFTVSLSKGGIFCVRLQWLSLWFAACRLKLKSPSWSNQKLDYCLILKKIKNFCLCFVFGRNGENVVDNSLYPCVYRWAE